VSRVPSSYIKNEGVTKMKARRALKYGCIFTVVLSLVGLATLAPALAEVRIANVREYEMRRHIQYGQEALKDADDTYPQLAESLDNVVPRGIVTWDDRGRMEKASLVKVKIKTPDKEILRAFGLEEVRAIENVVHPELEGAWSRVTFAPANGAGPSFAALQIDNDGSFYQMITHVAIKVDGVLHRLPLREDGHGAFSVTQNYFGYLAQNGKLKYWLEKRLKSEEGPSIVVVRNENRMRFQQWFNPQDLAFPDRAYVILPLSEGGGSGGADYEIVFGWEPRKLQLGGGAFPGDGGLGGKQFLPGNRTRWRR